MEITFKDKDLKKDALTNGLGLGLVMLVLGIVSFYVIINSTSMWVVFGTPIVINIILPIVIAVFFSIDLRKKVGGFWNFKRATSGLFLMFLTAYVVSTLGNLAFSKLIEPDMASKMQSSIVNTTSSLMLSQGLDQATVDEKAAKMNSDFEKQNGGTVMQKVQGYAIGILFVFIFSLIFGAIFKKDPPLFVNE